MGDVKKEARDGTGKHIILTAAQLAGHLVPLAAIGHALVDRGHNVYLITAKVSNEMPSKLLKGTGITFIQAGDAPEDEAQVAKYLTEKLGPKVNTFVKMVRGRIHLMTLDGMILKNLVDQGIVHDKGLTYTGDNGRPVTFKPDLVIGDHYSAMFTGEYLADRFDIPLIYNSPTVMWDRTPPFPYPIHTFPRGLKEMTFFDRCLSEAWRNIGGYQWVKYLAFRQARANVGRGDYRLKMRPDPGLERLRLANTAVPFDYPVAVPPLCMYTGALIYPPPELDPDGSKALEHWPALRDWLNGWPADSVVVISMGSHARLTVKQGQALLDGLQKLGTPALWALRVDNREFLPPGFDTEANRLIRFETWIPQKAVLAHPATGAFVGHCGMGGTHEAMYYGVPMLGMPVFIDQPELAARLRDVGAGLSVDVGTLTGEKVTSALGKLTGKQADGSSVKGPDDKRVESSYTLQAKKVSKYLKLQGGVTKAVQVVEMAIDAGTDMYLLPSHGMPYWKRNRLDVYGFFLLNTAIVGAAAWALSSKENRQEVGATFSRLLKRR